MTGVEAGSVREGDSNNTIKQMVNWNKVTVKQLVTNYILRYWGENGLNGTAKAGKAKASKMIEVKKPSDNQTYYVTVFVSSKGREGPPSETLTIKYRSKYTHTHKCSG